MAFDQLPSRFICYYSTFVTMVTDRVLLYNYVRILKNTLCTDFPRTLSSTQAFLVKHAGYIPANCSPVCVHQ